MKMATKETKSHFDFGLYGNLNGNEYGNGDDTDHFAHAYYREELKANGLQRRYNCSTIMARTATHIRPNT